MNLQTNRYGKTVPSVINSNGTCISTPLYVSPSTEVKKALLNAFRSIRTEQLAEMGYSQERPEGSIVVVDATAAPLTPIENELGMNEESLRLLLFGRNGLQERLVIKLQNLTGITVFSKEDAENTYKLWLNHLFNDEESKAKRANQTSKAKSTKTTRTKKDSQVPVT